MMSGQRVDCDKVMRKNIIALGHFIFINIL